LVENSDIQRTSELSEEKITFSHYITKKAFRNFLCTLLFWVITSANYFLIEFELKYLNGGIFRDAMTSSLAEVVGCLFGGIMLVSSAGRSRIRLALIIVNALPVIGAVGILIFKSRSN